MAYKFKLYQEKLYTPIEENAVGQTDSALYEEPANSGSDTLYVSKAGNDSTGDGTKALPYLTLAKAFLEADATFHQVCILDDQIYSLDAPLDMGLCDSFFSAQGVQPWLQYNASTLLSGYIADVEAIAGYTRGKMAVYNGELYAILSDGTYTERVDKFDGTTWTNVLTLANVNIISIFSTDSVGIAGIYFGTDTGKIYQGATEKSSTASNTVRAICEFGGYLFAFLTDNATGAHTVMRSADGATWSSQTNNIDSVLLAAQLVQSAVSFTGDDDVVRLAIASETQITYTESDVNSFVTVKKTFLTNSTIKKLYVWDNALYILLDTGLYKTVDLSYFQNVQNGAYSDISADVINDETGIGKLYLADTSGSIYRSVDGREFSLFASSVGTSLCSFQGLIYSGEKVINSYFLLADKETTISNIRFDTNIIDIAVYSPTADDTETLTLQNCTLIGCQLIGVYGEMIAEINNCYFKDCINSIQYTTEITCVETLFVAITHSILVVSGAFSISFSNITAYDFGEWIYNDTQALTSVIENSIFYFCNNELVTTVFNITFVNCMVSRVDLPTGAIMSSSLYGNPLFKNKVSDWTPKSKKGGDILPAENPVVENGIGCYLFSFVEQVQDEPLEHTLIAIPDISYDKQRVNFFGNDTVSGDYISTFTRLRRIVNMKWSNIHDMTGDINQLDELFGNDELCYLFADIGVSGTGTVTQETVRKSFLKNYGYNTVFKVLECPDLDLAPGKLWGFCLEDALGNEATILYNTETKIYFRHESDIPLGVCDFQVQKIKGRIDGDTLSTDTLFSKEFDTATEYEVGANVRFIQTDV